MRQLCVILTLVGLCRGADVGCSQTEQDGVQGHCVQRGCCNWDYHVTDPNLCNGANEVCCYRENICPQQNCFPVVGTWISRYRHHGTAAEVDAAFQTLKSLGIDRVQFNVWANGELYYQSATASANGVQVRNDRLSYAVEAGRRHGIKVYAWYEYGNMANYGSNLGPFAQECANKGWLLYNSNGGPPEYISPDPSAGNFAYLDPTLPAVQEFLRNMIMDAVRNYDIDGIQLDDHYRAPNGFQKMAAMSQSAKFNMMRQWMQDIALEAKSTKPSIHVSYSPSPLTFARDNHNVDWATWLRDNVVEELVPQYYRTTAAAFRNTLDEDIPRVPSIHLGFVAGVRLSGAASPPITPSGEVDQMVQITKDRNLHGVSFWFADNLIDGTYTPTCPTK